MGLRMLVTGGCGFIGSHLVDILLSKGHRVVVLDALSFGSDVRNLPEGTKIVGGIGRQRVGGLPPGDCVLVVGDVSDAGLVGELVAGTDVCFHLAAQTHVDRSYGDVRPFVDSNVVGSYAVLEAFRNSPGKRLVFMSTDEVYGDKRDGLSMETDPLSPRNLYSTLKSGGDLLAQTYAAVYGTDVVIARPANNYGPRQFEEKLVPKIATTLLRRASGGGGDKIPIYGDGSHVRDWLFVRDTAQALLALWERGRSGHAYNLGAHQFRTVTEVVRAVSALLGVPWEEHVVHVADRICGDSRYALDLSKATKDLAWTASTAFKEGMEETVRWHRMAHDAPGARR
jgi:dTDP-glucose 4,6-dehydratase